MAYIPPIGSTVAFQGTVPWSVLGAVTTTGSVISISQGSIIAVQQGSVATVIIGGSIAASFTPPANQSVSGTVGASIIGLVPVSVSNFPTNQNVSGSVVAFPVGNQSVSGTVGASIIGNVPVVVQSSVAVAIISGSIAATFTPPANQSVSGTVNIGTGGPVSVLGTMSVLGTVPVTQATTPWIITGSVQGTPNQSVSGTVQVDVRSSVAVVIIGGSIAASFTPPANQSVSGTVGASIIGQLPAGTAMIGSVAAYQGSIPWTIGSIYGNISGSVAATVTNTVTVVSSIAGGIFPISGSVAATITNTNVNVSGSVVAFQGTNPFVVNFQNSSIIAIQAGSVVSLSIGSVITVLQAPSIVGTYAEDAASASGDKGFLVMGARNDTLASVTSADGDYSSHVVGPAGELIAENAPLTKWVSGTASMLGGVPMTTSVTVIAAQGTSIFTYITGVQVANLGSASVLVSFGGATSSLIGYTIAPAGGGSNIYYQNGLKTSANAAFSASVSGAASIYVSAQGFISKT